MIRADATLRPRTSPAGESGGKCDGESGVVDKLAEGVHTLRLEDAAELNSELRRDGVGELPRDLFSNATLSLPLSNASGEYHPKA